MDFGWEYSIAVVLYLFWVGIGPDYSYPAIQRFGFLMQWIIELDFP